MSILRRHFLSTDERTLTDERQMTSSYTARSISPNPAVLHPKYRIISKLGDGGHGDVYDIVDEDFQRFALKVQAVGRNGSLDLKNEFLIYEKLLYNSESGFQIPGIPSIQEYTEFEGLEYMVMERLGKSLEDIAKSLGNRMLKGDILMIGIQAVRRLRDLHEKGILHRDVKPQNFAMGCGENRERTIYIIDFGLATCVDDWSTYDYDEDVGFAGTVYYASSEALLHMAPTRKGDLEGLAYTLLCLAYGELPWIYEDPDTGRRFQHAELGRQRQELTPAEFCLGFPELTGFFEEVSSTRRTEKPNYERLINLLEKAVDEVGHGKEGNFEWLESGGQAEPAHTTCSGRRQEKNGEFRNASEAAAKITTEAYPAVPPGFEFVELQKKEGNARNRNEPSSPNNYHANEVPGTVERRWRLPPEPQISPEPHKVPTECSTASESEGSGDCSNSSVRNSSRDHRESETPNLIERPETQPEQPSVKNSVTSSDSRSWLVSPRREIPGQFIWWVLCLLSTINSFDSQSQQEAPNEDVPIRQRVEDTASRLTKDEAVEYSTRSN